jgi:hypothetical protein
MITQISLTESMKPRKSAKKPCNSDIHSTDVQGFSYSAYTGGPGGAKSTVWKPADGTIQDFLAGNGWIPTLIAPKDTKDDDAGAEFCKPGY